MMQRNRPPELEPLDAAAGPARVLSSAEAEAHAQRVLKGLRAKRQPLAGAWLVAGLCLLTLGVLASRAVFETKPAHPERAHGAAPAEAAPASAATAPRAEPPASAAAPSPQPATPHDWLKLANAARERRDYARARQLYVRAVEADPTSDEAYAANVAAADLEREHLHAERTALRRYAEVLRARPAGPLSEQARAGVARAYAALGEPEREAEAWVALLNAHPGSWFADEAQQRLRALEAR